MGQGYRYHGKIKNVDKTRGKTREPKRETE